MFKGTKAIDFSLKGTDGKTYSLDSFKGKKALLIVFICNHCPYVVPKISWFIELQKKYQAKGLQIIGINSNDPKQYPEDSFEKMQKYSIDGKYNFAYLFDETQQTAKDYDAQCTPDLFLFNEKRELVYHGRIDDAHEKPHSSAKTNELEEAIIQLLNGKEITIQTLPSMGCSIKWK